MLLVYATRSYRTIHMPLETNLRRAGMVDDTEDNLAQNNNYESGSSLDKVFDVGS